MSIARVTQSAVEITTTSTGANARVTQSVIEQVTFNSPNVRVTQSVIELVTLEGAPPGGLTASCNNPPQGYLGVAYSQQFGATFGTPPYTWTLQSGSLPTGLSLASTGLLTGTPTVAGVYSFTLLLTDSVAATTTVTCSINIFGITCANPPNGTVGTAYTHTFPIAGGSTPYSVSVPAGTLPFGLTFATTANVEEGHPYVVLPIVMGGILFYVNVDFSTTSVLSGTPLASGTFVFTLQATDANGLTSNVTCSITIGCPSSGGPG